MEVRYGSHLPPLSQRLSRVLGPVNRFFDRLYHSNYNPLYRSGTLAIGFLSVMIVTGVYLLCFYSVADPHGSVSRISSQEFGSFIRAVHRYSADLTVLALLAHIMQLAAQGKTWGPRTRAWTTGVLVSTAIFLSAFSGFVLTWDVQGQLFALTGARLLQLLPFLTEVLRQAFDGSTPVGAAFFFVNVFLHAALPLLIIFGLWVHTSKLARARWFPIQPIFISAVTAVCVLSIIAKPALQEKADLLTILGRVKLDWWYGFWIPALDYVGPLWTLALLGVCFVLLLSVPWWLQPRTRSFSNPSVVDEVKCTGCTQCASDCPWEAITMVPRSDGRRLVARVASDACVSCGICAASCADQCIGPPGRTAVDQLAAARAFVETHQSGGACILTCCNNGTMLHTLGRALEAEPGLLVFPVECCGTIHSDVSEVLLRHFSGLAFVGCAVRNCMNRDGLELLSGRTYERRVPFLSREIDRKRVLLSALSDAEVGELSAKLKYFRSSCDSFKADQGEKSAAQVVWRLLKRVLATASILAFVAFVNQIPYEHVKENSVIRLSLRLPAARSIECRPLTAEEKATLPLHMQRPQVCASEPITYSIHLLVDGVSLFARELRDPSQRDDRPLLLSEDIDVPPGEHGVEVTITPDFEAATALTYRATHTMLPRRIYLIRSVNDTKGVFYVQPS